MRNPEIDQLEIHTIPDDSDRDYILVVGVDYGEDLHSKHDSFPMAAENVLIESDELSEYTKKLADRCGLKLRAEKAPVSNVKTAETICCPLLNATTVF